MREEIYNVIKSFYHLATTDILIGYHFDKFSEAEELADHLERITTFWEMQLYGSTSRPLDKPFHLLFTHLQLKIKRGELGRWILLFHRTLESHEIKKEMSDLWKQKIAFFEERFKSHPQMFS